MKSTAALWYVCARPASATSNTPDHHTPPWSSRYIKWTYKLTNRRLSLMPSSARPNRVEVPRNRASWPSAESNTSDTMNNRTPMTSIQRSRYTNRCPATRPMSSDHSVTWSGEMPVGYSARAIRIPTGRKKRRSSHSSTARPLSDKSFRGFTEHVLHGGEGAHRLILLDDERRVDAHLGIVDHRKHAARQQRVEDPPGRPLFEKRPRAQHQGVQPDQQAAAAPIQDDRHLRLPAPHLGQHLPSQPAGMLDQVLLEDRLNRDPRGCGRERIPAVTRRAAAGIGERLGERDLLARDEPAHGEAAAEPLSHGDHVGDHALVLDGEHLPGAPEPGDHLVANQQRAELVGETAERLEIAGRRDDVARGPLDRLDDDRGHVLARLELHLLPEELHAVPLARRECLVERAARARGVRRKISARHEGAQRVLEARAEHGEHTARLAVKAAPKPEHLGVSGARLREPQRRLDGFSPARIELRPVQVSGRELREQLDERRTVLGGEAADVNPRDLTLQRRHVAGMRVPETRHPNAREKVDVAVAVHVVQDGALAALDRELAEQRHTLRPGSEVERLEVEQRLRPGPGDLGPAQGMRHACFRCAKRPVM